MCGIVGYIGFRKAQDVIIDGLEKLEYRGYDSSGIAILNKDIKLAKFKGRLSILNDFIKENPINGNIGIGHTRWATHGAPSDENSHPHLNNSSTIAVVHNGIIENYSSLKDELELKGYKFLSQTDTEVISHLLDYNYSGCIKDTVAKTVKMLKGAFALAIIDSRNDEKIIAVRKESPLIIGLGDGENFIASDIPAILNYTKEVYFIDNKEIVEISKDNVKVYDFDLNEIEKEKKEIEWTMDAATKGGFEHFMIKEIFEQPKAIEDTISRILNGKEKLYLDNSLSKEELNNIERIYIVACGTAYNAGCIGKIAIEKYSKIKVDTDIASEFRYSEPFIDEKTLVLLVSQSGETADTLAAMKYAKKNNAKILSITNVVGSSIARDSDYVIYTWAGPEISVASTKAYTTQIIALILLALDFAIKKDKISEKEINDILFEMKSLPDKINYILNDIVLCKNMSTKILDSKSLFYIGRGVDYKVSLEAALKLKEISYIHTEAFAAGELKHGTIALIEDNTPVIAIATQNKLLDKILSNIIEVKSRGAKVYSIGLENDTELKKYSDDIIYVPETLEILQPILSVIPTQIIAYYTSYQKGFDVDKPRNLAKSVTVE